MCRSTHGLSCGLHTVPEGKDRSGQDPGRNEPEEGNTVKTDTMDKRVSKEDETRKEEGKMKMTFGEAINRLIGMEAGIRPGTVGGVKDFAALEMAISELKHLQNLENAGIHTDKKTKAKEVTVSDLTIMAEYVNKYKVEIELTISPDEQRMDVKPWKPVIYSATYGPEEKTGGEEKRDE